MLFAALIASGCASTGGAARPSPFPTAPMPASEMRPVMPAAAESQLIQTALGFRGVPYRLGGDTPDRGFDCSGFVRYVFGLNQVTLPRTVSQQSSAGRRVDARNVRPGDLLFFATSTSSASHVGIAIGAGQFVHAPGEKGVVRIDQIDSPYWKDHFLEARRVVPGT